jgi:hypothetical protein
MARVKHASDAHHYFIIAAVIAILGAVVVYGIMSRNPRDPITDCSSNSDRIENTYALLIDTTDTLGNVQAQKINNLVESLLSSTVEENRFQIYTIDETESRVIEPIFDRCSYQTSSTESPAVARFRAGKFDQELNAALKSGSPANRSPIIYSINAVASSLPRDESQKHLIIVSDFYEHSDLFSMYSMTFDQALVDRAQQITSQRPDLQGVQVYLRVIDRENLDQGSEFIQSWLNFLQNSGATLRAYRAGDGAGYIYLDIAERITG